MFKKLNITKQEDWQMERIKRFLLDDAATAEATSTVVMIACAAVLLVGLVAVWYNTGLGGFFNTASTRVSGWGTNIPASVPTGS